MGHCPPPSWVGMGTESDPVGEQAHCAGQLGQVSKGEWNQPAASPPASVRVSVLSPCSAQRGKASYGDPPLSLFDFLEFCGLGLVGEIEGGGRRQAELPLSASAGAPPSVVQSGDSIHVKPTFLEPTGPARSSHTGGSLSCLMRK